MESLFFSHYQIFYNAMFFTIVTLLVAFAVRRESERNHTGLIKIIQQG